MSNYLKLFNNHNEYTAFTQTEDFVKPNVSHCIQENEVHYNPYIKPFIPLYLYSDETTSEDLNTSKTVVGIVVAPKEHFSDGKMRVISLYNMVDQADWSNPTTHTGTTSSDTSMKWTIQNNDVTGITNIMSAVTINADNTIKDAVCPSLYEMGAYFPSDKFTYDFTQEIDGQNVTYWAKYPVQYYSEIGMLPSSFLEDGISKNPIYTDNSIANALSYIEDGTSNTNAIIDEWYASGGTTVDGIMVSSGCPAASACRLYCPNFHNGEWYLPTLGELGYVMANYNAINEKIVAVNGGDFIVGVLCFYWSSTENGYFPWVLHFGSGSVMGTGFNKSNTFYVRAFLAL